MQTSCRWCGTHPIGLAETSHGFQHLSLLLRNSKSRIDQRTDTGPVVAANPRPAEHVLAIWCRFGHLHGTAVRLPLVVKGAVLLPLCARTPIGASFVAAPLKGALFVSVPAAGLVQGNERPAHKAVEVVVAVPPSWQACTTAGSRHWGAGLLVVRRAGAWAVARDPVVVDFAALHAGNGRRPCHGAVGRRAGGNRSCHSHQCETGPHRTA